MLRTAVGLGFLVIVPSLALAQNETESTAPSVVHRLAQIWSTGETDSAGELFAATFEYHDVAVGERIRDLEEFERFVAGLRQAVPDLDLSVDSVSSCGRHVAAEWTMTGTQVGSLEGIPGSGKWFEIRGASIVEVDEEGRIVRNSDYYDLLTWIQQVTPD